MDKTVLITGATGHSGKYAIERFAMRRDECSHLCFRVLVRSTSDTSFIESFGLPLEMIYGDITDDDCLKKALAGVDILLNIFGIISDPARVARMAAASGVQRIISVHTTGIYSKYKNASEGYIRSDREITTICEENHIALTILRPTMIYGDTDDQNMISFIRMVDRFPRMPVVNGGRYPLQPVHRRDLGHAYADVLLAGSVCEGQNYVLSGDKPIMLRDMLGVIAAHLGKQIRFLSVPYWFAITGAWALWLLSLTKLDYREKVQRLVEPRAYSHEDATRDFGYTPVSFSEGVRREVQAYLSGKRGTA